MAWARGVHLSEGNQPAWTEACENSGSQISLTLCPTVALEAADWSLRSAAREAHTHHSKIKLSITGPVCASCTTALSDSQSSKCLLESVYQRQ